jgi:hypothetical protein
VAFDPSGAIVSIATMPRAAEARDAWWAEVDEVRERIERRRARDGSPRRRGVRVVGSESRSSSSHLTSVGAQISAAAAREARIASAGGVRRRPRARPAQLVGPRPDRVASWAVLLGFLLVLAALLSAH